jgi:predicted Ser/Thr protein kinase
MSINNCQISRIEGSVIASGGASTVYIGQWRRKQVAVKHVHVGKDAKEVIEVELHLGMSLTSGLTGIPP